MDRSETQQKVEYAIIQIEEKRDSASKRQLLAGGSDQGLRSQVTSGGHLDALATLISDILVDAGLNEDEVFTSKREVILPGYFRPEKSWDIVAMHKGKLVAAIELKSIWSSYGNNMNNRTEEAVGSGFDLRTASKYNLYGDSVPWMGYVFVIRDDPKIHNPTHFYEPHFPVDKAYEGTGYLGRSIATCKRLMIERVYDRVFYGMYDPVSKTVSEPSEDMSWAKFETALRGKVAEVLA